MRLEHISKFFFAKSTAINDSPRATATESLTGTDIMAALGLADLKSGFGLDLFLAKQGISKPDRAVESLVRFAMVQSTSCQAVAELDEDVKRTLLQILANFAYLDYARSAASVRECECCSGTGFIEADVFSMKSTMFRLPDWAREVTPTMTFEKRREVKETVRVICKSCNGKGAVSNACRCHGKGVVLDKKQTELQGVPVNKTCGKCSGRGYARLPAENVRRAICSGVMELSEPTWRRNFKPFYELLISQCHKEEAIADLMLAKVTN